MLKAKRLETHQVVEEDTRRDKKIQAEFDREKVKKIDQVVPLGHMWERRRFFFVGGGGGCCFVGVRDLRCLGILGNQLHHILQLISE